MENEAINKRRNIMILLNVYMDNFYAFKNFEMNLTYPKKIVGSTIKNEHLPGRTNFRYKKVNVIMGANASGKTTIGRMLMKIFNFIERKNYEFITSAICDCDKSATFVLDMASKNNVFYRIMCVVEPKTGEKYAFENIKVEVRKEDILKRDSYESCAERVGEKEFDPAENYVEELEKIESLTWFFEYPDENEKELDLPNRDETFRIVLENILKSLDPSINAVTISNDADNAYVVHHRAKTIILQSGEKLNTEVLSSGTKAGVKVSAMLASLIQGYNSFYYCDEKFPYIHSDIEKAILSLMIDFVGDYDQLFFTTHNTDILDMNLPKHTFTFLKKNIEDEEHPISCVEASSLLKRSTDSVRHAVENDVFSTAPALERIFALADFNDERCTHA